MTVRKIIVLISATSVSKGWYKLELSGLKTDPRVMYPAGQALVTEGERGEIEGGRNVFSREFSPVIKQLPHRQRIMVQTGLHNRRSRSQERRTHSFRAKCRVCLAWLIKRVLCRPVAVPLSSFSSRWYGYPGEYSWEFLMGVCRPDLQILTLFQTKNITFHTRFQTWHPKSIPILRPGIGRNYVIITWIRTPTKRFLEIHFEFA